MATFAMVEFPSSSASARFLEEVFGWVDVASGPVTVEPFAFPGGRRRHRPGPGGTELAVDVAERQ